MRTENLDRLISALGNPAHQVYSEQTRLQAKSKELDSDINRLKNNALEEDAVSVETSSYTSDVDEKEKTDRQAKIERLTEQVRNGTYNPSSYAISEAFVRELGL